MSYPVPEKLSLPIQPYRVTGYKFSERIRRRGILWATHLGEDILAPPGTKVIAAGDGEVVYSMMLLGSLLRRSWGGVVIIGHASEVKSENSSRRRALGRQVKNKSEKFYTVYGHLKNLQVEKGNKVTFGQQLGEVAEADTPENGWWHNAHLHFALYTGPWHGIVLPGWKRPEQFRTRQRWWHKPTEFIARYNKGLA
jgi:murein DD-endopeptidase MepM/ murein hydrolase activator NlpD